MDTLLTVRQLQGILHVDRITIYRMLADGRLTGIKVGGQWRFRQSDLEDVLAARTPAGQSPHAVLPLPCIQAMQEVFGQALDVGVMCTDMGGIPVTSWSNSCAFCNLVMSTPAGREHCQRCWTILARTPGQPEPYRCHANLGYLSSPIEVEGRRLGLVIVGQIGLPNAADTPLPIIARTCNVPLAELRAAYAAISRLDHQQLTKVQHLIQIMAAAVSRIGHERQKLISRLDRIAVLSTQV